MTYCSLKSDRFIYVIHFMTKIRVTFQLRSKGPTPSLMFAHFSVFYNQVVFRTTYPRQLPVSKVACPR